MTPGQIPLFGEEPPSPAVDPPAEPEAVKPEVLGPEVVEREAVEPMTVEPPEAGTAPEAPIPVGELNERARRLLEGALGTLWVGGEVSGWRPHRSGHCYFGLRDGDAQVSCVMFRADLERLPAHPEEGMRVAVLGRPTVYPSRGSYQLVVRDVRAEGEGLWQLAFQRLKAKLAEEGLLAPERKRALPRVPVHVGIVTSRSGAAVRDVVAVARRRAPWARLLVADCRVQGEGAAESIVAALDRLIRHGRSEVVILTRGGGSVEDLWAFNEESVARAIAASPIPTVSAVGHEIDVTIADLVADFRAPTPSAAAELVLPDDAVLRRALRAKADTLVTLLRSRTLRSSERARRAGERLVERTVAGARRRREWTARLSAQLDALSPLGTLSRGYAVPLDARGRVLRTRVEFEVGEPVDLRIADGTVGCRVESVEPIDPRQQPSIGDVK